MRWLSQSVQHKCNSVGSSRCSSLAAAAELVQCGADGAGVDTVVDQDVLAATLAAALAEVVLMEAVGAVASPVAMIVWSASCNCQ